MQIFTTLDSYKANRPLTLALGTFDGMHLGHQKILKQASSVFTFQEHPQQILRPDLPPPGLILSPEHKLLLLEKIGIEVCFFIPFTAKFSEIEADIFVRDILVKHLRMKKMVLGYNAHFGHERKGSPVLMQKLSTELGFEFEEIGPVEVGGQAVSSSRIRKLLVAGDLEQVAACLGRPYSLLGKVVHGEGRGKQIGFPTANLETTLKPLIPFGVYPVKVALGSKDTKDIYEGVLNYGVRPTFGESKPVLEAFLFGFNGDLYGKTFEVFFYPRIRSEQPFKGPEALKTQILKDIEAAKRHFTKPKA